MILPLLLIKKDRLTNLSELFVFNNTEPTDINLLYFCVRKYPVFSFYLDERSRRVFADTALGHWRHCTLEFRIAYSQAWFSLGPNKRRFLLILDHNKIAQLKIKVKTFSVEYHKHSQWLPTSDSGINYHKYIYSLKFKFKNTRS